MSPAIFSSLKLRDGRVVHLKCPGLFLVLFVLSYPGESKTAARVLQEIRIVQWNPKNKVCISRDKFIATSKNLNSNILTLGRTQSTPHYQSVSLFIVVTCFKTSEVLKQMRDECSCYFDCEYSLTHLYMQQHLVYVDYWNNPHYNKTIKIPYHWRRDICTGWRYQSRPQ